MFTGIVEERGRVVARRGSRLVIEAGATREGTDLGSSLAVNGVCLTAVASTASGYRSTSDQRRWPGARSVICTRAIRSISSGP
jgi:Riboflavin synthase alpha chain